jgi:hypothetical protein
MSVKVMAQVWELDLPHAEKFVLLAMADHADHDGGNVHPAVATVARKTGYSDRQVQRIIDALEAKGLLRPDGGSVGGRGKTVVYRIATGRGDAPAEKGDILSDVPEKGDILTVKGDICDSERVTSTTIKGDICDSAYRTRPRKTEPSIEPSIEPSKEPERVPAPDAPRGRPKKSIPVCDNPPTFEEVRAECEKNGYPELAEAAYDFQTQRGWRMKSGPLYDWPAAIRTWKRTEDKYAPQSNPAQNGQRNGRQNTGKPAAPGIVSKFQPGFRASV